MNYPLLLLPEGFLENLDKVFPPPVKPTAPVAPVKPSKRDHFYVFIMAICFAAFMFFIKIYIVSIPLIILAGFIIFSNSEKKQYEYLLGKYNTDVISFNIALKQYHTETEIEIPYPENYQNYKRNQSNELILNSAATPIASKDYKKGASHDFFKRFLAQRFNDSILESASINLHRYPSYIQNDFNLYVTDFAYIDKYTNLKICIEIDEPYELKTKKPIHLNDRDRNAFFTQNNWVVIRFAEEQVVLYPELCCDYIREIIHCFDCDFLGLRHVKTPLPKVQKWNSQQVKLLIAQNYRNTYLDGKVYFSL
jgi:very-short-patch-repair endonuclease